MPRASLPDWVLPALIESRRQLAAAEAFESQRGTLRAQLAADAAAADRSLSEIAAATAPARDAYRQAQVVAGEARDDYVDALRRHGVTRWPLRRLVQAEVDSIQRRLQRADHHLDVTRQATAALRDACDAALTAQKTARRRLDAFDSAVRPDPKQPTVEHYRQRAAALTTWVRWANGHDISAEVAAEAIMEVISDRRFPRTTASGHPHSPQRPTPRHPEREPATTQPLPTITPSRGFGLEL